MRKIKMLLAMLVVLCFAGTIAMPQNVSASAAEKQEIIQFVDAQQQLDELQYDQDERPALDELLKEMPDTLSVYLADSAEKTEIPVTWYCAGDDYENSHYYYYQFSPKWDESKYSVKDGVEVPYIGVYFGEITGIPKARSFTGSSNETQIYNYLTGTLGCNKATAVGILANIYKESSFNPLANNLDTNGQTSYGICQWNGSRFTALKNYCGSSYNTVAGQLSYLKYELSSSESNAWSKMQGIANTADGAYTAGYRWAQYFERCAHYYNGVDQYATRGDLAKNTFWPAWGGSTKTTYDPQGCFDSAVGGTGTVTVSGWAFDKDVPTQAIAVHVYIGGPAGSSSAEGIALTANQSRVDVGNAYPGVGNNHGFSAKIPTSKTGTQTVYVYGINTGGGSTNPLIGSKTVTITKDTTKPTISNAKITNVTKNGYTVSCTVSDNVKVSSVKFPTWTISGGQDDLVWHTGTISGNTASCYIKTSDHKNELGTYITDIYAYDLAGNQSNSARTSTNVMNISQADTTPPVISNIKVAKDSTGYTVTCTVTDNIKIDRVMFPTWTLKKGQDDLTASWQTAASCKGTINGNQVTYRVNISAHNNEKGTYMTHIYAYDIYGNVKSARCPYTRIEALDSSAITEKDGNKYARYDEPLSWKEAKAYCEQLGGHLVTISSQEENNLVQTLVQKGTQNYYYIGLTDEAKEGTWQYVTGGMATYFNWDSANNEPGGSTKENYACILAKKNGSNSPGKWADVPDRITNSGYGNNINSGFVCEFEKSTVKNGSSSRKITAIKLSAISGKIAAGKKVKLTASLSPSNASNTKLTWRSSNTKVATVNQYGIVTFKKNSGGKTVVITATATDGSGRKATFRLKSMKGIVKKIRIKGKKTVKAGKKLKLKAKVKATKGANKKLIWKSSNTKYATVSAKGVVRAKKAGKGKKVKITAMATDGSGKKAAVKVKIK